MDISIKLNKNFVTQYNKLQAEYGEEMAKINGFADSQLSYTDFIDNFIDKDTVSDASIDGNSNVNHKDIVTLEREMPKPHEKLLAFNKIYYEIQKKYGFKTANEWIKAEWRGDLYLHDANTATWKPYCYKGEELITIKDKEGKEHIVSFYDLYDQISFLDEEAQKKYDSSIQQEAFFPKNIQVLDVDKNGNKKWVQLTRVVKHKNEKPMRFIKAANGLSLIVTEDHPMITDKGEIPAKEITKEHKVFTVAPERDDNCLFDYITEGIPYNNETGWILGMALSEGDNFKNQFVINQKLDSAQAKRIREILNKYGIPFTESGEMKIFLKNSPFEKWLNLLLQGQTSVDKRLPSYFMGYPNDFMDGVIAGMIDGDGTLGGYKNRHCYIRIASEVLCHQLETYLRSKDIFTGNKAPFKNNRVGSFTQRLPMFSVDFTLTKEEYFLNINSIKIKEKYTPLIKEKENFKEKKYEYKYGLVSILDNSEYIESCNEVYDITTETGHFVCNGILSHNCFAYDLTDLANKGLYFIDGINAKPAKHYVTFIDFVKEFVSFAANRSSGACGLPNLIPYLYYFWKKDIDSNYMGISEEYAEEYARQGFQRFVYAVNQPYLRDSSQSAFSNCSIFDRPYFEALFGGASFPDGTLMIDYEEEIIEFQKWFLDEIAKIREENMFTFPVLTISLLRKDHKFADEDFAKWAIKHNMRWSDSNLFIDDSVNSLSNCCRLRSNVEDLGFFSSIGGTALKVGSVKVSTINLARIALESNSEEEYLEILKEKAILNLKVLDRVRHIIKRNVEKGLLPNFTYNLMDFEHLYSTTGVIGVYETMKKFNYIEVDEFGNTFYKQEASDFGKKLFETLHSTLQDFKKKENLDYMLNVEQIPGESAASKLMKKDKFLYPDANIYDLPLYGNQFIPLGIQTTLTERVRIASQFDAFCNGGAIAHINIDSPFDSFDKAWKMVNYIADTGLTYFAFNTKIQTCEDGHGFYGTTCPVCGKPMDGEFTRIVG